MSTFSGSNPSIVKPNLSSSSSSSSKKSIFSTLSSIFSDYILPSSSSRSLTNGRSTTISLNTEPESTEFLAQGPAEIGELVEQAINDTTSSGLSSKITGEENELIQKIILDTYNLTNTRSTTNYNDNTISAISALTQSETTTQDLEFLNQLYNALVKSRGYLQSLIHNKTEIYNNNIRLDKTNKLISLVNNKIIFLTTGKEEEQLGGRRRRSRRSRRTRRKSKARKAKKSQRRRKH